ncbi:MAG: hypothetical protein K8R35_09395 [Bacteroidales bacterium]|nr:hypothetical protein [Bacteroidales bacterium]
MAGREMEELILLKRRVDKLIDGFKTTKEELGKVRSENEELKNLLLGKEKDLELIKKEFDRAKLSGAMMGEGAETNDAKKRINELVREIDNCIALLNTI